MDADRTARIFRSRFNRVLSLVVWAAGAVVVAGIAAAALLESRSPWLVPVIVAVCGLTWVVLWRPHLRVDDVGVTIANVTHTVHVPWTALVHLDVGYSLRVHVPGRAIAVSAAPAPGRMGGTVARRGAVAHGFRPGDSVSVGELLSTDSGRAAALIRERWDELREAGLIDAGEAQDTPVRARADRVAVATMAAATALVAVAAVLGG